MVVIHKVRRTAAVSFLIEHDHSAVVVLAGKAFGQDDHTQSLSEAMRVALREVLGRCVHQSLGFIGELCESLCKDLIEGHESRSR